METDGPLSIWDPNRPQRPSDFEFLGFKVRRRRRAEGCGVLALDLVRP